MSNESQPSAGSPDVPQGAKAQLIERARTVTGDAAWVFVHHRDPDVTLAVVENENLSLVQRVKFLERRDLNARVFTRIQTLDYWWKSQAVRVALAKNPKTPLTIVHPVLRSLSAFSLCDVANSPYVTRDVLVVIERVLQDRLKVMPIGQRITLARKTTATVLEVMLKGNPHRFVVEAALGNPRLTEKALEIAISNGEWDPRALELVLGHADWGARYNVRRALFRNRSLEVNIRRDLAQEITRQDLLEFVRFHHKDHTLIRIVTIEFERRGYPDPQIKGLRKKGPKAAGAPEDEAAPRPAGKPPSRGLSFDELRAMMEADLREAEAATADESAGNEMSGDRNPETEPPPEVPGGGSGDESGEDDDLED